ncbi:short-chain dehydrogenase [Moniliophthora roreri MCA 2997]|uniref:Short-chain dehydrogenase n=1 Tax=Moniliophthora roreri (strain MCA 2997) TaxID=1381753 RepID=V2XWU3_MONRO|nr:short-chain dehydrogenase [Moniliophthora roreri MCA 2997]
MAFQIKLEEQQANRLFDLRGVVAVVSGGASGIGLMISSTLIANGAKVYIVGPKQADLDRIARLYNAEAEKIPGGGKIIGIEGDISVKSEAKRLANEIGSREPHVTVLFNNAGILAGQFVPPTIPSASAYVSAFFDSIKHEDFTNVLNTNAVGHYWMTFAFLPLLEKWKNSEEEFTKKFVPQVIMTSSMNGWTKDSATAGLSYPYMFSKSAIGHATSSLAHELLPLGIRVNGIAPGLFPSEMSAPGSANEAGVSTVQASSFGRLQIPTVPTGGTRRDMGALALCLVANWFINGETVLIDGGTLLKHPSSY